MTKNILNQKNVDYEYIDLGDLSQLEQDKYLVAAESMGLMNMPIIIKDEVPVRLEDLI
jgi:glutaredoxin